MRLAILLSVIFMLSSCKNEPTKSMTPTKEKEELQVQYDQGPQPIMLDDFHYYVRDRVATNQFFRKNFYTRPMKENSPNPFRFIDFQLVRPQQSTLNISKKGPFPGIKVGAAGRWERPEETPALDMKKRYGVHWIAFSTKDLESQLSELKANGVGIIEENYTLAYSNQKAALIHDLDYNMIVVVEDKDLEEMENQPYAIDHVVLLVESLEENVKYFSEVFGGSIDSREKHQAKMTIGNHNFVLCEPEGLGLNRSDVIKRDPKIYRPDVDHIGFLYKDLDEAHQHALDLGYEFLSPPIDIVYYDKPTLYTFLISYSPDRLQCEMYVEKGRLSSRTEYLD